MIYIFWTCQSREEAKKIVRLLLDQRLIACASLLPEVESLYRWKGKVEEGREVKVILKTQAKYFEPICAVIGQHGSYEVPEIAQVEVGMCNPRYLAWVMDETQPS
jgi:periplasmic divalent cation tolerance protein